MTSTHEDADGDVEMTEELPLSDFYLHALHGLLSEVQSAIEDGVDVNAAHGDIEAPALTAAAFAGHAAVVDALIRAGADVNKANKFGDSPLYVSSQQGHEDVARRLVDAKADVNQGNKCGFTPLFIAAQKGHLGIMQLLHSRGANVNKGNVNGATPLFTAAGAGKVSAVTFLLKAKAEVNLATADGATALSMASQEGHADLSRILLAYGADVNQTDKYGATPLMYAAGFGNANMVETLMDAGADWTLCEDDGYTAMDSAREKGHDDIANMIDRWAETVVSSRMALLAIARRGDTQTALHRGSGDYTASMGDLAGLPVEIVRKIAMMIYVPQQLWRNTLPQLDWRHHAIMGRAGVYQARGELDVMSRKVGRLENALSEAERENDRLRAEIARMYRALNVPPGSQGSLCPGLASLSTCEGPKPGRGF